MPTWLMASPAGSTRGHRRGSGRAGNTDPVLLEHLQQFRDVRRSGRNCLIDGREHLGSTGVLSGDLQHLAATLAILERVHCSAGYMHQRARLADVGLAVANKVDLAAQHVERFVPVMAMRRRACALVTLL